MKILINADGGELVMPSNPVEKAVASAATKAMREGAKRAVAASMQEIAGAGFSGPVWRNAIKYLIWPKRGTALNPSAWIHSSSQTNWADVFETGKHIEHEYMWIPLPSVPKLTGSPRSHMTPKQYVENVGPLVRMKRPGKTPMLGAVIRRAPKAQPWGRFASKTVLKGGRARRGSVEVIPMFVGVASIWLEKRFNVEDQIKKVADDDLPGIFDQMLKLEKTDGN